MAKGDISVLMTADTIGGVFTYALTLARELSSSGATIHLATMGDRMRPEQREATNAVPGLVVHESSYALEWMDDPWDDVARAGEWLRALEQRIRPDVVHLNGYCHGDAGFVAPTLVAGHSCVLSWWQAVLGEEAPPRYDVYRRAVRRGLHGADAVLAPSAAMMRSLERFYGELRDTFVIPNGAPAPPANGSEKEPLVLSAGRLWDRAKNVEAVARVAPQLPWKVLVAGSNVRPDGTRVDLPGVELLGWLNAPALGDVMDRASIFALPARYEPFGLSALEAAQRGCALVLGDIESLREVWADAALFVPPGDDDALASALIRLAGDVALRSRLAEAARARAVTFTARRTGKVTLAVYRRLLASRDRSLLPCA